MAIARHPAKVVQFEGLEDLCPYFHELASYLASLHRILFRHNLHRCDQHEMALAPIHTLTDIIFDLELLYLVWKILRIR